jgi:hypothetical protein
MQLDDAELGELRRWGTALRDADNDQSVAAGRAILMLVEELERVRFDLRQTREQLDRKVHVSNDEIEADPVSSALHGRLQRVLGREQSRQSLDARSESGEDTDATVEAQSEAASARSWIETLRRQQ